MKKFRKNYKLKLITVFTRSDRKSVKLLLFQYFIFYKCSWKMFIFLILDCKCCFTWSHFYVKRYNLSFSVEIRVISLQKQYNCLFIIFIAFRQQVIISWSDFWGWFLDGWYWSFGVRWSGILLVLLRIMLWFGFLTLILGDVKKC